MSSGSPIRPTTVLARSCATRRQAFSDACVGKHELLAVLGTNPVASRTWAGERLQEVIKHVDCPPTCKDAHINKYSLRVKRGMADEGVSPLPPERMRLR